jgi:hypothetical protein
MTSLYPSIVSSSRYLTFLEIQRSENVNFSTKMAVGDLRVVCAREMDFNETLIIHTHLNSKTVGEEKWPIAFVLRIIGRK